MRIFAQKPRATQRTSARSTIPSRVTFGFNRQMLHLQPPIGNQAAQRKTQTPVEELGVAFTGTVSPHFGYDFNQIAMHPPAAGAIQTKLAINRPGDRYEQEADRLADQVMGRGRRFGSQYPEAVSNTADSVHASAGQLASSAKVLEPGDRQFFESRFHSNFADVRVSADSEANRSALCLQARAYAVGNNINFASGEYRPGTTEGRHLLAHELSHVIQQRSICRPNSLVVQRQPKGTPTRQAPESPPEKPQSLKEAGVGPTDPVSDRTAQIIDEVLLRNRKLAPYIGDKLKSGFRIAEKGRFVKELTDNNFDNSFRTVHGLHKSETVPSHILGFYDSKNSKIHLRPDARFGTALHESVHRLASPALYTHLPMAMQVSSDLVEVLTEGVTAYFTDSVLIDEGLTNWIDAYPRPKAKAGKLVTALGSDGFGLVARLNFNFAIFEVGNRLGLSLKQYGELKGGGPKEVFRRMNNLL